MGLPLGEAFQLRDDLLGVYGDSATTGKPVGDDLREGKLTPLLAVATARVDATGAAVLARIGCADISPEDIAAVQALLVECGACDEVERAIEALVGEALAALDLAPITDEARAALQELATYVAVARPLTIAGRRRRDGPRRGRPRRAIAWAMGTRSSSWAAREASHRRVDRVARLDAADSSVQDVVVERFVDPTDGAGAGLEAGTPFSVARRLLHHGPLRAAHVDAQFRLLTLAGMGTVPGVGIPMALISGRLATGRVDAWGR